MSVAAVAVKTDTPAASKGWWKHIAIYGGGILLLNAVSYVLLPLYTHCLTPAEYGVLELLNRTGDIVRIVIACGIAMAALSLYQHAVVDNAPTNKVFPTAIIGATLTGGSVILVLELFSRQIARIALPGPEYAWAVAIMLWATLGELLFGVGLAFLQAQVRSGRYVAFTVARVLFAIAMNVVFVAILKMHIKGALIALLLQTSLFALVSCSFALKQEGLHFDRHLWVEMLRFGLPFVPGGFLLFILNNGDRYFFQIYRGPQDVGLYALGSKLGGIAGMIVLGPFLRYWGGVMISVARGPDGLTKIGRIGTYVTLAYVAVALPIALYATDVVRISSAASYAHAAWVVPLIALAQAFWVATTVADTPFYVCKKTQYKPILLAVAAAVAIAGYSLLIPRYGLMGGAATAVVCFAVFAIVTWIAARRVMPVRFEYLRFVKVLGAGVLAYVVARLVYGSGGLARETLAFVVLAIIFIGSLWLSRFVHPDEIVSLRHYGRVWLTRRTAARKPVHATGAEAQS